MNLLFYQSSEHGCKKIHKHKRVCVQLFLTSSVNTRMQQQPVSNLLSSVAESKETQTPLIEQLRTAEKITIYFMQNLRLQQTGDTSIWSIRTPQVIWSVSIFPKLNKVDCRWLSQIILPIFSFYSQSHLFIFCEHANVC